MNLVKTVLTSTILVISLSSCMNKMKVKEKEEMLTLSISEQRNNLAIATKDKGFGPQSPRDIDSKMGQNSILFETAPSYQNMNLCNIHFHKNAEHKGGEFTTYAGDGDLNGKDTGFKYDGSLTPAELQPVENLVCDGKYGSLNSGDTIEVHYVHSSAQVQPGPTLNSCLQESIMNPQLRVETQVFVLVNDDKAHDFNNLAENQIVNGKHQAVNMLSNTGTPIAYAGSTTGPGYNQKGSPLQVSWSVRPQVAKLNIDSVKQWCESNVYDEDHAHGVRNLVINPDLLSNF
jgi:hypothetical protein